MALQGIFLSFDWPLWVLWFLFYNTQIEKRSETFLLLRFFSFYLREQRSQHSWRKFLPKIQTPKPWITLKKMVIIHSKKTVRCTTSVSLMAATRMEQWCVASSSTMRGASDPPNTSTRHLLTTNPPLIRAMCRRRELGRGGLGEAI